MMQFDNAIAELELEITSLRYVAEQWEQAYNMCYSDRENIECGLNEVTRERDEMRTERDRLLLENAAIFMERDGLQDDSESWRRIYTGLAAKLDETETEREKLRAERDGFRKVADDFVAKYHAALASDADTLRILEKVGKELDEAKRGSALLQVENHSLRSERDEFRDISDEFVGYYHEAVKRRDEMQANYYKAVAKANEENETVAVWVAESGRWESNYYTAKRQRDEMEGKFHVVSRERDNAEREQAKSDIAFERIKKERERDEARGEDYLTDWKTRFEQVSAKADSLEALRDEFKEDYESLVVAFDKTALALDEMGEERDTYKVYVDFYEETKARMKEVFDD